MNVVMKKGATVFAMLSFLCLSASGGDAEVELHDLIIEAVESGTRIRLVRTVACMSREHGRHPDTALVGTRGTPT